MKLGFLIPTVEGMRPRFLERALHYIDRQVIPGDIQKIVLAFSKPSGIEPTDITWRYKQGIEQLKDCDLVFFIEDDDWYSPFYVQHFLDEWKQNGKPDLIGIETSIYYHLIARKMWISNHPGRASAMSTAVNPKAITENCFGADNDPWFDIKLWQALKGYAFKMPDQYLSIGIKHGFSKHGGVGHNQNFHLYNIHDPDLLKLESMVLKDDFEFYKEQIRFQKP